MCNPSLIRLNISVGISFLIYFFRGLHISLYFCVDFQSFPIAKNYFPHDGKNCFLTIPKKRRMGCLHNISRTLHNLRQCVLSSVQCSDIHTADKFLFLFLVIIGNAYQFCVDISESRKFLSKRSLFNKPVKIIHSIKITVRYVSDQTARSHIVHNTEHIIIGFIRILRNLIQIHFHVILYTVILYHSQCHIGYNSRSQKACHRTHRQYAKHFCLQCFLLFFPSYPHIPVSLLNCITKKDCASAISRQRAVCILCIQNS